MSVAVVLHVAISLKLAEIRLDRSHLTHRTPLKRQYLGSVSTEAIAQFMQLLSSAGDQSATSHDLRVTHPT